jgi:hypothetical protein
MEKFMEIFWRCFSLNGMKDIPTLQENEIKINKNFGTKNLLLSKQVADSAK